MAKEYGVSVQEVKQEMQAALEHTYKNTPNDGITGAWQNKVPKKGKFPPRMNCFGMRRGNFYGRKTERVKPAYRQFLK